MTAMDKAEYKALVGRIRKAERLPVKQRDAHRDLLDALIRQAARYEFEHHALALYRFPDETVRICVRHLATYLARLIQAPDDAAYHKAQEQVILAVQQLLLCGAAMGSVTCAIEQLNLFDPVSDDPDCPFETEKRKEARR